MFSSCKYFSLVFFWLIINLRHFASAKSDIFSFSLHCKQISVGIPTESAVFFLSKVTDRNTTTFSNKSTPISTRMILEEGEESIHTLFCDDDSHKTACADCSVLGVDFFSVKVLYCDQKKLLDISSMENPRGEHTSSSVAQAC